MKLRAAGLCLAATLLMLTITIPSHAQIDENDLPERSLFNDPDGAQLIITPTARITQRVRVRLEEVLFGSAAIPLFGHVQIGGGATYTGGAGFWLNPKINLYNSKEFAVALGGLASAELLSESAFTDDGGYPNSLLYVAVSGGGDLIQLSGAMYSYAHLGTKSVFFEDSDEGLQSFGVNILFTRKSSMICEVISTGSGGSRESLIGFGGNVWGEHSSITFALYLPAGGEFIALPYFQISYYL